MPKVSNGHFGSYRGKMGAVTGYKRLGEYYIRQSIVQNSSRSAKQLTQRALFRAATSFLGAFASVFRYGFGGLAGAGKSAYNLGFAANYETAKADSPSIPALILSKGNAIPLDAVELSNAGGSVKFAWQFDESFGSEAGSKEDIVYCVLYHEHLGRCRVVTAARGDLQRIVTLPLNWLGSTAHAWIFAAAADGSRSDSQYLGTVDTD